MQAYYFILVVFFSHLSLKELLNYLSFKKSNCKGYETTNVSVTE